MGGRAGRDRGARGGPAWETYALIAASVAALVLVQSAYQAGPLAASMPVIDAAEPLVAVTVGLALFGERVAGPAWRDALAAVGMGVAVMGIVLLDSSPMLAELHARMRRAPGPGGLDARRRACSRCADRSAAVTSSSARA